MDEPLTIAGRTLRSRLILGTGGFPRLETLAEAIRATRDRARHRRAAARSTPPRAARSVDVLDECGVELLPNTAGCYTARDAVLTAQLAREAFGTDWVKLEVIGDERTLLPDAPELLARRRAARRRRLHRPALHERRPDPGAAPGGRGLRGGHAARLADRLGHGHPQPATTSRSSSSAPACRSILDAGVGTASDAALAMELGCDGVLCASAISRAQDPVAMAHAIRGAVEAGRLARGAGRIPRRLHAQASTPDEGLADFCHAARGVTAWRP